MPGTFPSPAALVTPNVSNTASVLVAPKNLTRAGLFVFNPSPTITLWITPDAVVAAVGVAGSIALQPLQGMMLGPPTMGAWINGLNAIASAGATNAITVLEFYP